MSIAKTPQPPYYAVIFTANSSANQTGYEAMAEKIYDLVQNQPGFLGVESADGDDEITVSYWESLDAIKAWKANAAHGQAQKMGKDQWYDSYRVRICKVEREYGSENDI